MFLQGFLFALGFGAGSILFAFLVATALLVSNHLWNCFRKPSQMDESIDIRRWQERKIMRKSS